MEKQIVELEAGREDLVAVCRVNSSTTMTLHKGGEVTIRQVRKTARPNDAGASAMFGDPRMTLEEQEVIVKLQSSDLELAGALMRLVRGGL